MGMGARTGAAGLRTWGESVFLLYYLPSNLCSDYESARPSGQIPPKTKFIIYLQGISCIT